MPAGIEITNDANTISIDQDFFNLALTQKGTFATVANVIYPGGSVYNLSINADQPLIALNVPGNVFFTVLNVTGSPGAWNYEIVTGAPVGTMVEYYLFGVSTVTGGPGGLFEVYNADGKLVYSAATTKAMKVVGVLNPGTTGSGTYTAGRKYAVITNTPQRSFNVFFTGEDGAGNPSRTNQTYGMTSYAINNNTITSYTYNYVNSFQPYKSTDVARNEVYSAGNALVIDVTNY